MRKICTKIMLCILVALCTISTVSMCMPVKASDDGIMPLSAYEEAFSFKGGAVLSKAFQASKFYMKLQGTANNNNNETVYVDIYIQSTNITKHVTFYTDGAYHRYGNYNVGSSGSNVTFTFTAANPEIRLNMYFEAGNC